MRASPLQQRVLAELVPRMAAHQARRLPGCDRDDLAQEFSVWVLTHGPQLDRWFRSDEQAGERRVAVALRNEARDYAREQSRQSGLDFEEEDDV